MVNEKGLFFFSPKKKKSLQRMNKWGRHLTFCLEEALPVLHSSASPGSIIPAQEPVEAVNCEPASGRFVSSRGQRVTV